MYDEQSYIKHLNSNVFAIRKHKGQWVLIDNIYNIFRHDVQLSGRKQIPKVLVEPNSGHGYKTPAECRSYKVISDLFNSQQEAETECTKRNNDITESTCVNCGYMKNEPVYFLEGMGYCAHCLITALSVKGMIFVDGFDITL